MVAEPGSLRSARRLLRRHTANYRIVDYLTQGYLLLVAALILVFQGARVPHWPAYVAAHAFAIVGIHILVKVGSARRGGPLAFLRAFYPIALYSFLYTESHLLDSMVFAQSFDAFFVRLEQSIFGCQPSRALMWRFPQRVVSEIAYFGYFTYYFMVLGVGLALYWRSRRHYYHYLTVVSFMFYVCYFTYIVLPVMGPHGDWVRSASEEVFWLLGERRIPPQATAGPFYHVMKLIYRAVEARGGAAFPSSHVAVAITTLYFTFLYWRPMRWVHLTAVVLLTISTVYCGYHYVVDILGAFALVAVALPLVDLAYRRSDEFREPAHAAEHHQEEPVATGGE